MGVDQQPACDRVAAVFIGFGGVRGGTGRGGLLLDHGVLALVGQPAVEAAQATAQGFVKLALHRPVYDAALSRSKQATEYLQHPPIGSLSFGRGLG